MQPNPFHDLYLSEAVSEEALVEIFSPIIVSLAGQVFETGNVIVKGLQGTGKTMLLNLFRPESRIAYRKAGVQFPLRGEQGKFIAAGVNLRKCGALEFAQHLSSDLGEREVTELELLFADFLNYWIVQDFLSTLIRYKSTADRQLWAEMGLTLDDQTLDRFALSFASDDCWFGGFNDIGSFSGFQESVLSRISLYRRFLNLNLDALPRAILDTKTVIGDPILKLADHLRRSGVIHESTKIFVRIDQYEQLTTLNIVGTAYGDACQRLINKALGARDGRVSYRIGTRSYGWPSRPVIYRTSDVLELKRDFSVLNMDELFRRRENSRTWKFPAFARDIFERRLKVSALDFAVVSRKGRLNDALNDSARPQAHAERYARLESRRDIIRRETSSIEGIPGEWAIHIERLAHENILHAWMTCAWVRQKLASRRGGLSALGTPPLDGAMPWKPYWYKERVPQALMQIASANRQALGWTGEDEILNLCGGQILVFLFVMQHIWDAWLRDNRGVSQPAAFDFPIPSEVQSQGVQEASYEWKSKQIEGPNSRQRKVFVDALGRHLHRRLVADKAMSYPGANGFSLRVSDIELDEELESFLCQSVSYGDLYEAEHTSKNPGERRRKYYLSPILSPVFRIPSVHTKEPEYINLSQLKKWLLGKDTTDIAEGRASTQHSLFEPSIND